LFSRTTTFHHPRKRANELFFDDGGVCSPPRRHPMTQTTGHEHQEVQRERDDEDVNAGTFSARYLFYFILLCFTNLPSGEGTTPPHLISSRFDANGEGLNNPLLFPPPPPSTAVKNEQARSFSRTVDRRWLFSTTTFHCHRKRASTLVFDGGGYSPLPPPSTTIENEQPCSFSRLHIVVPQ